MEPHWLAALCVEIVGLWSVKGPRVSLNSQTLSAGGHFEVKQRVRMMRLQLIRQPRPLCETKAAEAKPPLPRLEEVRPVRRVVKAAVSRQEQVAQRVVLSAFNVFDKRITEGGDAELRKAWNGSSLKNLLR